MLPIDGGARCCSCVHYTSITRVQADVLVWSPAGVEVAASLVAKARSVTVVDLVEAPFQLALGKQVGNAVKKVVNTCARACALRHTSCCDWCNVVGGGACVHYSCPCPPLPVLSDQYFGVCEVVLPCLDVKLTPSPGCCPLLLILLLFLAPSLTVYMYCTLCLTSCTCNYVVLLVKVLIAMFEIHAPASTIAASVSHRCSSF